VGATFANTEAADSVAAVAQPPYFNVKVNQIEPSDTVSTTGVVPNHGRCALPEASDSISSQAQALIKGTVAAAEPGDVGTARLNDGRLSVVEAGDGVAATGTATTFSWQIVHP
jgi:hypothetical protein